MFFTQNGYLKYCSWKVFLGNPKWFFIAFIANTLFGPLFLKVHCYAYHTLLNAKLLF